MECQAIKNYFEHSSSAVNLKEISHVKILEKRNACVYILNETMIVKHEFERVNDSTFAVFDRPIKEVMVSQEHVWIILQGSLLVLCLDSLDNEPLLTVELEETRHCLQFRLR